MSISLACACGKSLNVKDELAGRKIRCPACNQVLLVPEPIIDDEEADAAVDNLLKEGEPTPRPGGKKKSAAWDEEEEDEGYATTSKDKRGDGDWEEEEDDDERERRRRKKRAKRDPYGDSGGRANANRGSSYGGVAVGGTVISGLLMMVGAIAWFVLGICLADRIFFYPPILFIFGLVAFVKGCMGYEEN